MRSIVRPMPARLRGKHRPCDGTADTLVFVGPGWHSFEQLSGAVQRRGVHSLWVGYPFRPLSRLRTSLFSQTKSAANPGQFQDCLAELGPERVLDLLMPESLAQQLLPAALELDLPEVLVKNLTERLDWLDKQVVMNRLREHGIRTPRQSRGSDAASAVDELGLPLVVKGTVGGGGEGVHVCRTRAEVEQAIAGFPDAGHYFVEEYGDPTEGLCYGAVYRRGLVELETCYRGTRSSGDGHEEFGPFDQLETLWNAELADLGRRSIALLNGCGVVCLDVVRAADSHLMVIDVNLRPFGPMITLQSAGVDLTRGYLAVLRGESVHVTRQRSGIRVLGFPEAALFVARRHPVKGLRAFARSGLPYLTISGARYMAAEIVASTLVLLGEWRSRLGRR